MNRTESDKPPLALSVNVETLAPCKRLVRFEVDPASVEQAFESMTQDFVKQARLPGFRPGKAPKDMVVRQYEKEIAEQVKEKLIRDAYRQGVKTHNLTVLHSMDLEEIQFARGQAFQFAATLEVSPEFQLPEYRGLPAKRESRGVTEADVAKGLDALRERMSTYNTVEREVQAGDIAVVNYAGTCDGRPLTDLAPTARGLTGQKGFWVEAKPDSFIPGFAMQLVGAKAGDKRTVNVEFPADFPSAPLAAKKAVYDVDVVEVKEKVLPALDDAFARSYGADTMDRLKEGVRSDLQNEFNGTQKRRIREQLISELLSRVNFELPETTLALETRNLVFELVNDQHRRGVSQEIVEKEKDRIFEIAQGLARSRVKMGFIEKRIAEREGIRPEQAEINARIAMLAAANQMTPQKYSQELERDGRLVNVYQAILHEKVLAFLHEHARIEDVPQGSLTGGQS